MKAATKSAFFRQSTWMVVATFAGGLFMALVHTVARRMGEQEYSSFVSLLRLMIILGVPASALQTIFARQAAAAATSQEEEQLRAATRALVFWTFLAGLVIAAVLLIRQNSLARSLSIANPAAIYFTAMLSLTGLWVPIGKGILQGRHHFGGLGWLQVSDGAGRFLILLLLVLVWHGKTASAMFAVMAGQLATVCICAWLTRSLWRKRATVSFRWKYWLGQAVPLTLGQGTILVMSSLDMLYVQDHFSASRKTDLYGGAMLTGFAIIQFIAPVALVMFARVAKNVARAEKTDSLAMTLGTTAAFGVVAALGCTILPQLPLRMMYFTNREMWAAAPLVPWFAWALLPLTLANVLVQNILARGLYRAVPWLLTVPVLYALCLHWEVPLLQGLPPFTAFTRVIQTLGAASLLLCLVAAWFSHAANQIKSSGQELAAAHVTSDKSNSPAA